MTEPSPKPLNRAEIWVSNRAAPIFGVLALLICVGAVAVFLTYEQSGNAEDQVKVLAPKVAHIIKCNQSSLVNAKRAEECAARIRIGLINCRRSQPCRDALLAAIAGPAKVSQVTRGDAQTSSPIAATSRGPTDDASGPSELGGGDALQKPSNHGPQQPGPATGPLPSPSPSPAPASPTAPEAPQLIESPGNGESAAPTAPQTSGTDVEVCVLEHTCLGVEVGGLGELLPKGSQ